MWQNRFVFLSSLLLVILINWVDIRFFGFQKTYFLSPWIRQAAHYTFFVTTAVIGYFNWRNNEKWCQWLWIALYVAVLLFTTSVSIIYSLTGHLMVKQWKIVMAEVRQVFMGPLPLLVFYLFLSLARKMSVVNTADKAA